MGLHYRFNQSTLKWIAVLLIALAALTLRVYAIDRLPPGLFGDEAVEGLDGYDSVEWIAAQPWCDGNVGMAGLSHMGSFQWFSGELTFFDLICI